ncbi:MAG TPA: class I SAM-dependent methyltransferase [Chloroflexota bacterium]|nr:class I SAM-dependent methyltransferase [Chloroflexota bacterium]
MESFDPATYGDRIADVYDSWHVERLPADDTVALLAALAGQGPALELGIGTGRIALPLAARGIAVHGIDASGKMVARLRAKPGGAEMPVVIGDFAEVGVDRRFALIYVVFNTFFALLTQDDQVRCFRSVADHLTEDGVFVIEAFVPNPTRYSRGKQVDVARIDVDQVVLMVAQHDPVAQRITSANVLLAEGGVRLFPVELRYAWPTELDLMARLAGLHLRDRWGGWQRDPFTATSTQHVSVYART